MKDDDELDDVAKEITSMTTPNAENLSQAQSNDLEATLASLDDLETVTELELVEEEPAVEEIEELVVEEVEAEAEATTESAVLAEDELDELEMEVGKAEAYASQESTEIATVSQEDIKSNGKKAGGQSRASTPRTPRDMASVPAEHFVLTGDVASMSDADKEAAKTATMAATPTQKKVAEKFENLFQSMAAGREPSKYTMTAFGALNANKTVTSAEIIAAYKASGSGEGTARSQTGQMMALLPAVGVAERDGKTLKLKEDSNVAAYLRKFIAA